MAGCADLLRVMQLRRLRTESSQAIDSIQASAQAAAEADTRAVLQQQQSAQTAVDAERSFQELQQQERELRDKLQAFLQDFKNNSNPVQR